MIAGVENSDPVGAKMGMEAVKGWLLQGADETSDKDFKAALEDNANVLDELVNIQLDPTLDEDAKEQQSQALGSPEHQAFLRATCPQLDYLLG